MVAFYTGTAGNDVMRGDQTVVGERDYINGGAGDDTIYGLEGNDTLTGDAGNDTIYGGNGWDGLFGGGGNDKLYGEAGNDSLTGNGGADLMDGGDGDDTFHYYVADGADTIIGGNGVDTFRFWLPSANLNEAMKADLALLKSYIDSQAGATGGSMKLNTVGVTLTGIEKVVMLLDGNEVPLDSLVNSAPVAAATVDVAGSEDEPVMGQLTATDADGDTLAWSLKTGPANGSVVLNEDGSYTYTPPANWSGSDSFTVIVADPEGASATQVVNVTVGAVADTPILATTGTHVETAVELTGGSGNDNLTGGIGDDVIVGGDGNDTINGDGGTFTRSISLDVSAALQDTDGSEVLSVVISGLPKDGVLSAGTLNSDGSWTLSPADLSGLTLSTAATDDFTLSVSATATEAAGGSTSTTAQLAVTFAESAAGPGSPGGNDTIDAGAGNDVVRAGAGDDMLIDGSGNDLMYGESGNDTFIAGSGNDTYDGGAGFDTIDFSGNSGSVNVNLSRGTATGAGTDKLVGIEGVVGSNGNDTITGSKFDNVLEGGAGNDKVYGGAGNDTVIGGNGNDTVDGGSGNDVVSGGDGNDKVTGGSGNDTIFDGAGNDKVSGGTGDDYMFAGTGDDSYSGGSGYDTLDFSLATSAIDLDISKKTATGFGDDKFSSIESFVASAFGDTIKGSSRVDTIDAGAGNDTIRSMEGADMLTGGAGNDTFVYFQKDVMSGKTYLGLDTITDFQVGDVLDLHDFLKSAKYKSLDDVVRLTDGADGATVSVLNGKDFVDVVRLEGFHEDSAADMLAHGMILV